MTRPRPQGRSPTSGGGSKIMEFDPQHKEFLFEWYCKKFGLPDQNALAAFYRDRKRVLEVGPGSGFNTRFIAEHCDGQVFAA